MFSIEGLTLRQTEILEFLRKFRREGKSAPTYREIAKHFGFKSPKAASDHVHALEKKGYVRRHGGRSRGIELLSPKDTLTDNTISVPILGNIPAGYPAEQTEHRLGTLAVDKAMLDGSTRHRLFALLVSGESMEGRSIHEGDWVVADADLPPHEGDVVVALIDGENTLKTLAKQEGRFFLKAESPKYSDLIPLKEMMIQGVVRSIFRRMY
ncbi:MAG: repressor LexA [Desulfobacteraceae bacterium Eth-SRB2]|nr:MAG: repressor LexA [Desulfobacteraceae bacterium Eth-SRB2]